MNNPKYRIKVIENVTNDAVLEFSEAAVAKGSEVRTDGLHVHRCLAKSGYSLNQGNTGAKDESGYLCWAHVVISNTKAFIGGTFHGLDACASVGRITYAELIG
jgi:hypothetical protein